MKDAGPERIHLTSSAGKTGTGRKRLEKVSEPPRGARRLVLRILAAFWASKMMHIAAFG
jgi:hypothetical protein